MLNLRKQSKAHNSLQKNSLRKKLVKSTHNTISSLALLLGTIIGGGIFGLPYVISKAGFVVGVIHLVLLGGGMTLLALMYGEIILRTKSDHQYPGYMTLYLGKPGKILATGSLVFGLLGSLIAYLLAQGTFFHNIFESMFGGSEKLYLIIFFVLSWIAIIGGLRIRNMVQTVMLGLIIAAILGLGVIGFPHVATSNLSGIHRAFFFLPFGAVLFSLAGNAAIVEVRKLLKGQEHKLKEVIIGAQLSAVLLYLLVVFVIVGMLGSSVSADPISDLSRMFGNNMLVFGSLFGILVIATTYIPISNMVIESLQSDYGLPRWLSWVITAFVPLAFALSGLTTFIATILFVGTVVGVLDGLLIILAHRAARKIGTRVPEYTVRLPF